MKSAQLLNVFVEQLELKAKSEQLHREPQSCHFMALTSEDSESLELDKLPRHHRLRHEPQRDIFEQWQQP